MPRNTIAQKDEEFIVDRFFQILESEFASLINAKNGWGKNEVMTAFHKAFAIAISKYTKEKGIELT